jgi:restriction system protein
MAYYMTPTSDKKKIVAFLLCLFFGVLGIHRFYVGRVGTGLLYLFSGGLLGIGVIVDLIRILIGSFRDNVGMPLRV